MSSRQLAVLIAAIVVFFTRLGATTFWDFDETLYAEIIREMIDRGDWIVPLFNGDLVTDKPPMTYWLMIAGFKTFGASEFAARFAFAALAVGTVWFTYRLGSRLYSEGAGLWAALALATNIIFDVSARACTPDSPLVFFTVAALWLYVKAGGLDGARVSLGTWTAIYALLGLGTLTKGPVAFVFPIAIVILFHMWKGWQPAESWSAAAVDAVKRAWIAGWAMRPVLAIAVIVCVAGPWYAAVGMRTDGQWLRSFIVDHNAKRFLAPNMGHSGPVYYHWVGVMIGFFPWAVFLPQALVHLVRRVRSHDLWSRGDMFLVCWAGLYLVFFSFSRTKLPNYVLPAYPAIALVTGAFLEKWLSRRAVVNVPWLRWAFISVAIAGGGTVVGLSAATLWASLGSMAIGLVGAPLLVGGVVALMLYDRDRRQGALATFATTAVVFVLGGFAVVAPMVNAQHSAPQLVGAWSERVNADTPLAAFGHLDPSEVYYASRQVRVFNSPADVQAFFTAVPQGALLVRSDAYGRMASSLPAGVRVLDRRKRFLKDGELMLLGRPDAVRQTAQRSEPSRR
jgi:4-amino-4-deoxy-L-arabinose transferase-like glycosyltransferase